jgi:uncharacterized protein YjeT (DUF2065 family)
MGELLLAAFALMLVFEGVLPLIAPKLWRESMRQLVELRDGQLRFLAVAIMAAGLIILFLVI